MLDFLKLRESIKNVGDELAGLRAEIERKRQRFEFLANAPRPPADVADLVDELIDANAERWPELLRGQLALLRKRPLDEVDVKKPFPLLAIAKPDQIPGPGSIESALLTIFAPEIRRVIREQILSWDSSGCGPRAAVRRAELAQLDTEIAALEQREGELVDQARRAGIRL